MVHLLENASPKLQVQLNFRANLYCSISLHFLKYDLIASVVFAEQCVWITDTEGNMTFTIKQSEGVCLFVGSRT